MKISVFTGEWYPWHPTLYKTKTMNLTPEQDGIYRRLIDHYMETRHPLPDNDISLARAAGIGLDAWTNACSMLRAFFIEKNGLLYHEFCDQILYEQDELSKRKSKKAKIAAKKRWSQVSDNKDENANIMPVALLDDATGQDRTGHNKKHAIDKSIAAKQQGKKDLQEVFGEAEVNIAKPGEPAYDPARISTEILPGGWYDMARKRGVNDERVYQSFRKFKDLTDYPYSRQRWRAWIENEGAAVA